MALLVYLPEENTSGHYHDQAQHLAHGQPIKDGMDGVIRFSDKFNHDPHGPVSNQI